jgi:hypothetical protein
LGREVERDCFFAEGGIRKLGAHLRHKLELADLVEEVGRVFMWMVLALSTLVY